MSPRVVVSIVVFNTDENSLAEAIVSAKTALTSEILVIDNSLEGRYRALVNGLNVSYQHSEYNLGFGKGHNRAINALAQSADYFLILNPDVYIHKGCLEKLVEFMDMHPEVPLCSPKILNSDGSIQKVHKRLPTFKVQFGRRFLPGIAKTIWREDLLKYELSDFDLSKNIVVPSISGCFMFFRSNALMHLQGFDERYFLYQEDIDLSRRASELGPCVYIPQTEVTHKWTRGSHKGITLTVFNVKSALKYYLKWRFKKRIEPQYFMPRTVFNKISENEG